MIIHETSLEETFIVFNNINASIYWFMNEIDQQTVHLQHLFFNWIVLKILRFYYLFKESDVKNNQHQSIFYY